MKLKLFAKLFLFLLVGMLLLLGSMMLSVHFNFTQGLSTYLQKSELEKLQPFANQLGEHYQQQGSWNDLQDNPENWFGFISHSVIATSQQDEFFMSPPPMQDEMPEPPFPPFGEFPHPLHFHPNGKPPPRHIASVDIDRLVVMDNQNRKVVGSPEEIEIGKGERQIPILSNNQQVGWLLVRPNPLISDKLAIDFMRDQIIGNLWILSLALAVSILMALLMVRQILLPLRRIAAGTRALAIGNFSTQIADKGHDELAALARDFNVLGRTLANSEHARQAWLADISHELRTPLSVLRGELEALVDGIRTATPERIVSLHQEVLSLARLVDDLYQLSLSDLGALDYQFQSVDLVQCLSHIVEAFEQRFASRQLVLEFQHSPHATLFINGDAMRLAQLFTNLLENTYRYTTPIGYCHITFKQENSKAIIYIDDSAPSVAEEELVLLFDRFHRVDRSRQRQTGGAGLGLAICRNIVDAHNGQIIATASNLGGVRMTIEFPALLN